MHTWIAGDMLDTAVERLEAGLTAVSHDPTVTNGHALVCSCNSKRSLDALQVVGVAELADMIATDGGAELTCEFCTKVYVWCCDHCNQCALLAVTFQSVGLVSWVSARARVVCCVLIWTLLTLMI
jgi:hypothetical protein